jgi:hypothetical protein
MVIALTAIPRPNKMIASLIINPADGKPIDEELLALTFADEIKQAQAKYDLLCSQTIVLTAIYDAQEASRGTLDETKLEDCAKDPLSQLYTNYKILVYYRKALEPITAKRCEMRARLFDGELEFPPFDFLNGDEPALFDFGTWHACLLGGGR